MRFLSFLISFAIVFVVNHAHAWVDIKNANLAMTRTDFKVEGLGPDLLLERTYNSRVDQLGLFGRGWCSNIESSLTMVAKGLAVYRYCGAGRAKIFKSAAYNEADDQTAIEKLVQAVRERKSAEAKIPNFFKAALKYDIEIRATLVRNYGVTFAAGDGEKFAISNFPEGTRLVSEKGRFLLTEENGDVLQFDSSGNLAGISDRNGHEMTIEWAKGLPQSIVDSQKRRIVLRSDAGGHLVEASGPGGRKLKYRYSNEGWLAEVEVAGQKETYEYDSTANLTRFRWGKVDLAVRYDVKSDRVTEVTTPVCTTKYKYDLKRDQQKMSAELDSKCEGKARELVKYDFTFKENNSGRLYQAEMTAVDAEKNRTAIRYVDDNKPVWMERKGIVTEFSYDERGRLHTVKSPTGVAEYKYDEAGRLSVFTAIRRKGSARREIKYAYSPSGVLKSANDGATETKFSYDSQGRLSSVSNNKGRKFEVTHRSPASEVPSGLKSPSDGKIDLAYDLKGKLIPPRDEAALKRFVIVMGAFEELTEPAAEVWRQGGAR